MIAKVSDSERTRKLGPRRGAAPGAGHLWTSVDNSGRIRSRIGEIRSKPTNAGRLTWSDGVFYRPHEGGTTALSSGGAPQRRTSAW